MSIGVPELWLVDETSSNPVNRNALVQDIVDDVTLDFDRRSSEPAIEPRFDLHPQSPARKAEVLQTGPGTDGLTEDIKSNEAVIAVVVLHVNEPGLRIEAVDHFEQLPRRLLQIVLRQPAFGEVELVRAVDQLDCAFDVRLDVMLDADANIATPEEIGVVGTAGSGFVPLSGFKQPVLLQSAERRVGLALEPGMVQQIWDGALIDDRHIRDKMLRLVSVERIVVNEENGRRPQLDQFD